jgi:hypothetical protein
VLRGSACHVGSVPTPSQDWPSLQARGYTGEGGAALGGPYRLTLRLQALKAEGDEAGDTCSALKGPLTKT